jgi:hypothetical protein
VISSVSIKARREKKQKKPAAIVAER